MRVLAIAFGVLAACSGKLPVTRYYQLSPPPVTAASSDLVIGLESLATAAAYDDDRIVYRTTPYRLDYYNYHRWSSSPGDMIGNFLEQALERSGKFRGVVRDGGQGVPVILGGRVIAIEEIDTTPTRWRGRIAIELSLTDARSGAVLWTEQFDEEEPLPARTPEGLAKALSTAMTRIAARAAPRIFELAERQALARNQ